MILGKMLVRSVNYKRRGNREIQVRGSIYKKIKRLGGLFTKPNVKQKGKDLGVLHRRSVVLAVSD